MSKKPTTHESPKIQKNGSSNKENELYEKYQQIKEYEHRFNTIESEIRKLASGWLLVALGAIAFIVRGAYLKNGGTSSLMMDPKILISIVCLMANFGLLILWILDQMVYHRLLNSVFLLGLRMEYLHDNLPPIRTLMMLFSRKRGMAKYLRLYYLVPMFGLGIVSLISCFLYLNETIDSLTNVHSLICIITVIIPLFVVWKSMNVEKYEEIAEGFKDTSFVDYLRNKNFEAVLRNH
ncbi:MAG: hypothetical protein E3J56_12105 [Candidatus Aminicenantes bacterium]|nr:MAG: hypothetical protein E3J56_12105 [Candidatus Aminicenantes bacterium]